MIVMGELGVELVRLALQETVIAVEAALQRPVVIGPRRRAFRHGREMPFAGRECGEAVLAQNLGDGCGGFRHRAAHIRIARIHIGDRAHPHRMVVAPRQQAGAGGGAERGGVEAGEFQPFARQPVDIRRGDGRAIAAQMRKPCIVEHDHHHIGLADGRGTARPGRLRVLDRLADLAFEIRFRGVPIAHSCLLPERVSGERLGRTVINVNH